MVNYKEFIPHTTLQDYVKRFWIMEKEYTTEDSLEEVLPDACVELILNFGSPYIQVGSTQQRKLPDVFLIGFQSKPVVFQAQGVVKLVAARFFAWGVLPFLKTESQPDGVIEVELDDTWRPMVAKVGAKVHLGEYQKAVEELEDFLIGRRLTSLFDLRQVQTAARLLYHTKGRFRIAELADYCNLSIRQLQRQFDDTTGVSPKTLARTIRFEAIYKRLMFEPDTNLTDLAHEFGYTDQAHFINDFRAFINKTPGEFVQEMHEFQAILRDHENVVFLQSPPSMLDYTEGK
jgi:AraC-like DNA-binding protein